MIKDIDALVEELRERHADLTHVLSRVIGSDQDPTIYSRAADALTRLSSVDGEMETTAEERAAWTRSGRGTGIYRACIDIDRLTSALAAANAAREEAEERAQRFSDDLQIERQVSKGFQSEMRKVCEIIRCHEDDSPSRVAQERMDEIASAEEDATSAEARLATAEKALGDAYDNAGRSATDRFDVPPEHEPNPNAFHLGWEMCAREIAASIATKKIAALSGKTEGGT